MKTKINNQEKTNHEQEDIRVPIRVIQRILRSRKEGDPSIYSGFSIFQPNQRFGKNWKEVQ